MPSDQCAMISAIFYEGRLTSGSVESKQPVVTKTMHFENTSGQETRGLNKKSFQNEAKGAAIVDKVQEILRKKAPSESLCIVTFYAQQRRLICDALERLHIKVTGVDGEKVMAGRSKKKSFMLPPGDAASATETVLVATVDSMQGREADHVLLSCVRTQSLGFIKEPNRINIALSHARKSLFVVGSHGLLQQDAKTWRHVLEFMDAK